MVVLQISGGLLKDAFTTGRKAGLKTGNMKVFVAAYPRSEAEGSLWGKEQEPGLSSSEFLCFMS